MLYVIIFYIIISLDSDSILVHT